MLPIGHRLVRLPETPSTIDVARTLADEGAEHGTVVLADRQTAGRGRRGRQWTTVPGKSLAMTAILREFPEVEYVGLAGMSAALAVVRVVNGGPDGACGAMRPLQTKWPNDVVAEGRKLAGTLAELHGEALLLSLGLNINGAEADLPADLRHTATTLELLLGRPLEREQITARVLAALDDCWQTLLSSPGKLVAEWETLDTTVGKEVEVRGGSGAAILGRGRALGVDPQGRLRVLTAEGKELLFDAGDVTLA
jgi:BirA family biotin operon repressor/biotin-[acetyl-CoA-carboxylase] ligase